MLTHRWRELDSNFPYAGAMNLVSVTDPKRTAKPDQRHRQEKDGGYAMVAVWKSDLVGSDIDPLHGVFGERTANRGWGPWFLPNLARNQAG